MFTLWLLVFVVGSQAMLIAPLIPLVSAQLGVEPGALGTLVTAYAVAVGAFALLTGPVSDRVGRRRVLLAGTALMALALGLHWFASSLGALLAVRALAGVAGGVLNGAAVAYVGDYFPARRRGWANGWVISGFAAGQIAGIPIGTVLAARAGFRVPFLLFSAGTALALVLVFVVLEQPAVTRSGRLTLRGAVAGYATLLRRRDVAAATLVFLLMFGGVTLYTTYLPAWLVASLGLGAGAIAGLFLLGGLSNAVVGPLAGSLSDRVGRKRIIVLASGGIAATMALTPLAGSLAAVAAVFVVVMALFASRASAFTTLLTELVEGDRRGSLMSLTVGVGQVGVAAGGGLAGSAYATVGYPASALAAAACMALVAWLVYAYLPATGPDDPEVSPPGAVLAGAERPDLAPDALYGPAREAGYADD